jgi:flagellar biosynthesis/type III secretory pathway protein FliH
MPSSSSEGGWKVPFHAAKYPRACRVAASELRPGDFAPLVFPEVASTRRGVPAPAETGAPRADLERELAARLETETREAFQRGYAQAKEESDQGLESLREQTQGAFAAFRRALERSEAENARDAVDLAILLAEQVLRAKLPIDVDALGVSLAPAVAELEGLEPLTIMCDPATGELLRANMGALQQQLEIAGVQVEVDESFEPGDAVLQRGASTLDARISERLRRLRTVLLEQLGLEGGGAR